MIDDDDLGKIIIDEEEMSKADEQEVFDDIHDSEWSDDAEGMVDDDSVETNSRRNVRYLSIYELILFCKIQKVQTYLDVCVVFISGRPWHVLHG